MSNESNNESDNSERVNILLQSTLSRLMKMAAMASEPPPDNFEENVTALSRLLSGALVSAAKEGRIPNGLLWNVHLVSTLLVVEDTNDIIRFQKQYVAPDDLRAVIHFGQRAPEALQNGVALPTTVLVVDKSVVASEGYKALATLQLIKDRCLKIFSDANFELNEFSLIDPQLGTQLATTIIGNAQAALHVENDKAIDAIFPKEQMEKARIAMKVNPELTVEKLKTIYEPLGLQIDFIPVPNMEKTKQGVSFYESGHYNVVALTTETGILEVSKLNPYIYPDKPVGNVF